MPGDSSQESGRSKGTEEVLASELTKLIAPVGNAAQSAAQGEPEALVTLLEEMHLDEAVLGEQFTVLRETVTEVGGAWVTIQTVIAEVVSGDGPPSPDQIGDALEGFKTVFETIKGLDDLDLDLDTSANVGDIVVDYLVVRYLDQHHPTVYNAFTTVGVVTDASNPEVRTKLALERIPEVLNDPEKLKSDLIEWGKEEFEALVLLQYLREGLEGIGIPAAVDPSPDVKTLYGSDDPPRTYELRAPIIRGPVGSAGFRVLAIPPNQDYLPGIAGAPYGVASLSLGESIDLGNGWSLTGDISVSASGDDFGVVVRPKNDGSVEAGLQKFSDGSVISGELHGEATVEYDAAEDEGSDEGGTVLLGTPDATRLELNSLALGLGVDLATDGLTFYTELPSSGGIYVDPQGGFLAKVLPDSISFDFDTTVGWSSANGPYIQGGGKLEAAIPSHISLGPLTLQEVYLAVNTATKGSDLAIEAATSPKLELGPVVVSVKRMGVSADVSFPKDRQGNAGPVDVDVGFSPPDGVGLSVDAGPVNGGGFLGFDPEKHRYTGAFELTIHDYSVKVVGLLKTQLPGEKDGFSLLLLVTGELPPIDIGFGFKLVGIGGLLGVHRDMKKQPLQKAVRSGNLSSILFPENVVDNAQQIISDLETIFPIKQDVHVFGPMVKFAWGSSGMVTLDVGIVLSIPTWKISLLGKLEMVLPDEDAAIVDLNLAVFGFLDIPNKYLSIDASLYDSRIALFDVSGDMALRSSWGEESSFMLSVGGFHPRYSPPKSFPDLNRVQASLSKGGGAASAKVEMSAYLAITPNTFQVGAGVVVKASAGPASAHGELSFDALFRFDPFEFVVDFFAKLQVSIKAFNLGVELDGTLSGPKPLGIEGKLTINVAFISTTVHLDVSIGSKPDERELPTAKVFRELKKELSRPQNWDATRPEGNAAPVSLLTPEAGGEDGSGGGDGNGDGGTGKPKEEPPLLVHPLGTVSVRQTIVPLGVAIEKYGNARPRNTRFEVAEFDMSGETLGGLETLRENFAPGRFKKMSDDEKLNSEAFEKLPAGRRFRNDRIYYAGHEGADQTEGQPLPKQAALTYESSVIDETNDNYRLTGEDRDWETTMSVEVADELAKTSAVATSDARTTGSDRYRDDDAGHHSGGSDALSVSEDAYVVVRAGSLNHVAMSNYDGADNPIDGTTQVEARQAMRDYADDGHASTDDLRVVGAHEVRSYVVAKDGARADMSGVSDVANPADGVRASEARAALQAYADATAVDAAALQVVPVHDVTSST